MPSFSIYSTFILLVKFWLIIRPLESATLGRFGVLGEGEGGEGGIVVVLVRCCRFSAIFLTIFFWESQTFPPPFRKYNQNRIMIEATKTHTHTLIEIYLILKSKELIKKWKRSSKGEKEEEEEEEGKKSTQID